MENSSALGPGVYGETPELEDPLESVLGTPKSMASKLGDLGMRNGSPEVLILRALIRDGHTSPKGSLPSP